MTEPKQTDRAMAIQRGLAFIVFTIMAVELAWVLSEKLWLSAFLMVMIMAVIIAPTALGDHLAVKIPAEFQILAMLFSFAALFLGEFRSYYERIWWWDIALHIVSGLLLGILGFLLIHVLNETRRIDLHMRPRFVALFAFFFAVTVGTVWEVFEFVVDSVFGTNMQKPMFGDASGLTDTMWDLIVDMSGALAISLYGHHYLGHRDRSFIDRWIQKFIDRNPTLFRS